MMENYIFVVEGNHDIAYLHKILFLLGFETIRDVKKLNSIMNSFLPKKFPFKGSDLKIFNFIPYYFLKQEKQIMILNANGEKNILRLIDDKLSGPFDMIKSIDKILVFADGDTKNREEKLKEVLDVDYENLEFEFIKKESIIDSISCININSKCIPIDFFIFPDNENSGRLEDVLIDCIKKTDNELLENAESFLKNADNKYSKNWNEGNSKKEKALIGIVGNAILPGSSNTTVISSKRTKWISEDSKSSIASVNKVYSFIKDKLNI